MTQYDDDTAVVVTCDRGPSRCVSGSADGHEPTYATMSARICAHCTHCTRWSRVVFGGVEGAGVDSRRKMALAGRQGMHEIGGASLAAGSQCCRATVR
jgi:hypothetical protein